MNDDPILYESYDVVLRRNSDGLERTYHVKGAWHEHSDYWWTEGNGGCDCNRKMDFDRAGGVPEAAIRGENQPCGDVAYTLVRWIFPDGTSRECGK